MKGRSIMALCCPDSCQLAPTYSMLLSCMEGGWRDLQTQRHADCHNSSARMAVREICHAYC